MAWQEIGRVDFACRDCLAQWTNQYQEGYFIDGVLQSELVVCGIPEQHNPQCREVLEVIDGEKV